MKENIVFSFIGAFKENILNSNPIVNIMSEIAFYSSICTLILCTILLPVIYKYKSNEHDKITHAALILLYISILMDGLLELARRYYLFNINMALGIISPLFYGISLIFLFVFIFELDRILLLLKTKNS